MATPPACRQYLDKLSPFVDGELTPAHRQLVERHLQACADCQGRVADLRAEAGLVRVGLEMLADEADFTGFAQKVLARVTPERPGLWERLKLSLAERFTYQRWQMATGLVVASLVAVAAAGWMFRPTAPTGYGGAQLAVQSVTADRSGQMAPVVMKTAQGDAIIWLVRRADQEKTTPDSGVPADKTRQPLNPEAHPTGGPL